MNRSALVLGFSIAACALAMIGNEKEAAACGGCFTPPAQVASDITDERMLLSVSTKKSTLYDQIRYQGNPSSFAWVLPIHGTVDVGLSADVLFASMDALTATVINQPAPTCPPPPSECSQGFGAKNSASAGAEDSASPTAPGTVTVTKQENVGPYETVQLHATDSSALEKWLSDNSFVIPEDVKTIIAQYVTEGFDFLAMKLLPGEGVNSMRPVRVSAEGASLSLPLRMAAIGTGATVGITIWVVSDGRYEPQNFPFFHIEDKDLIWDWKTSSSNYTTLRTQNAANFAGKGWEMETSLALNEQLIENVIKSGGVYYGNRGGGGGGGPVSPTTPSDATTDYLAVPADASKNIAAQTPDEVRDVDVAALFEGMAGPNVRVTRMRSDISHAAMTTDFVLTASKDQSEISNIRTVTQSINEQCPIYDNCNVVGYGPAPGGSSSGGAGGGGGDTFSCKAVPSSRKLNFSDAGLAVVLGGVFGIVRLIRRRRQGK